jgi:putative ABC transport system substrate-binding protein
LLGGLRLAALGLPTSGLLASCGPAPWAQPKRPTRLGFVSFRGLGGTPEYAAFQERLQELGHVPGETIQLDFRFGSPERLGPELTALAANSDVLVAIRNNMVRAVQQATEKVPIVMVASGDPVRAGLVTSLARPGGNVTGVSPLLGELIGKRLQLLKEVVPGLARVGLLWAETDVDEAAHAGESRTAAERLGLELVSLPLSPQSFNVQLQAVGDLARTGAIQALMLGYDPEGASRITIRGMAAERRLPVMFASREHAAEGGLMAYGPSNLEMFSRAAMFVDKIIKGSRPADLPVEQPTKFDFVINLKTAQALGLLVPQSVLQQATEVIQ